MNQHGLPGSYKNTEELTRHVYRRIKQCINHMSKEEIEKHLSDQFQIPPVFTNKVWNSLEQQDPDFFREYYATLENIRNNAPKMVSKRTRLMGSRDEHEQRQCYTGSRFMETAPNVQRDPASSQVSQQFATFNVGVGPIHVWTQAGQRSAPQMTAESL